MKKYYLAFAVLLFMCPASFFAQSGWQQTIFSDSDRVGRDIIPAADGHFWVLVNAKVFIQGVQSWDVLILKMNAEGIFLDTVVITQAYGMALQGFPDGSFAILGKQWLGGWYDGKALVIKMDQAGQLQWQKVLTNGDAYSMIPDGSGGYFVGGRYDKSGSSDLSFLYRLSAGGDDIWFRYYDIISVSAAQAIFQIDNQNLLLIGRTQTIGEGLQGFFLLKVAASNGDVVWQKTQDIGKFRFDPFWHDFSPIGVVKDAAGNIIVVCPGTPENSPGSGIFRFNTNGDLLQMTLLTSLTYRRMAMDIVLDDEGNYIIAGGADFYTGDLEPLIEKRKSNGEVIWSYRLPRQGQIAGLVRGPDGSFLACGVDQGDASSGNTFQTLLFRFDSTGNSFPCRIEGYVRADTNIDCTAALNEVPLPLWNVLLDGQILLKTNQEGYYRADVLPGEHQVHLLAPEPLYSACKADSIVNITLGAPVASLNFAVKKGTDCPLLEVGITQTDFVLCDTSQLYVSWQNRGNATADEAQVKVVFDPYLEWVDASEPYTINGDTMVFALGTVVKNTSGTIRINVRLDCEAPRFATHCVEAHIEPVSFCSVPSSNFWNGAQVKLDGTCVGDNVQFLLHNTGPVAMSSVQSYRIYENGALLKTAPFILAAEQLLVIEWPAKGRTITLQAKQEATHPFPADPIVTVEGCGTPDGYFPDNSFATIFASDNVDPYISKICAENTARTTGNRVFEIPKGFGHYHWMADDSAYCEFSLRVTNPTIETIENLTLVLSSSPEFDLATFIPVAWSHPYHIEFRHSGEIFVQSPGIGLPPGSDFCFRFRLKLHPQPGYAFASITAHAYFDEQGPFNLYEAFYNVAPESFFLTNEATPASTDENIRLFGRGNSWDFTCDLVQTSNGDIFTAGVIRNNGEGSDLLVVLSDSMGQGIWQKTYKLGLGSIYATVMQALPDGSILVAGALEDITQQNYLNYSYAFIVRILADGTQDWLRQWKPGSGGTVYDIELSPDGDVIVWGIGYPNNGTWKNFMQKITVSNMLVWEKFYAQSFFGGRLKSGTDGFLYYFTQTDNDTYLLRRFNYNGDIEAANALFLSYLEINDFSPTKDGGLIIVGTNYEWDNVSQASKYYLIQIKLNSQFQTLWTDTTYYGRYLDIASVEATDQANFILGTIINASNNYNTLLLKTSLDGDILWEKTFSAKAHEYGKRLIIGQHHRLWLTAQTQSVDYFYNLQMMLAWAFDPDASVYVNEPSERTPINARVFPNPSADENWLEFMLSKAGPVCVKITDQTGITVWKSILNSTVSGWNKIHLPHLPAGAFIVTVQSDTAIAAQKLVRLNGQ